MWEVMEGMCYLEKTSVSQAILRVDISVMLQQHISHTSCLQMTVLNSYVKGCLPLPISGVHYNSS